MKQLRLILLISLTSSVAGCHSTPTNSLPAYDASDEITPIPARLSQPSATATARIADAISLALNGRHIALATDTFTRHSELTLKETRGTLRIGPD